MSLCISLIFRKIYFFRFFIFSIVCLSSISAFSQADSITIATKKTTIENIIVTGNHKTRTKIILRELAINKGDSTYISNLEYIKTRSQQNLINTSLFNFVTINDSVNPITKQTILLIDVKERWYIWPQIIFEVQDRNFNQWWLSKDLFRINYGAALDFNNFTGNKDVLSLIARFGYTERLGVSYRIPYINKAQTVGLNISYLRNRNNEINYKTENNKLLFYRDYHNYVRTETEAKIGITYRKNLYQRHGFEVEYNSAHINDTIKQLNANYFSDKKTVIDYFSLQYRYVLDLRDNKPYPLKGWLAEIIAVKDGIDLLKNETISNRYLIFDVRYFKDIASRFYFAHELKTRFCNIHTSTYYFNRALGWNNDFVRGYEYYVVDGQNYGLGKASFKYQLVKPRIIDLQQLKRLKKFNRIPYAIYVCTFGDAAYVNDDFFHKTNTLNNSFIYGYGAGIDLVTYYDNVLRMEYSINRQLEHGFFLHFTAGF